ncbi:hypothetical protein MWU59_13965 [Flavobacteriaceae bacterium F08102]|nr:hypothetical protein [Flavobacteriaceae bacterium F08102]
MIISKPMVYDSIKRWNLFLVILFILSSSCSKNEEDRPELTLATMSPLSLSDITANSVILESSIIDEGNSSILERGFFWSTENNPLISDSNYLIADDTNGVFTETISNLDANTEYFVKAYVKNASGFSYGEEISFKTLHHIYEGNVTLLTQEDVDEFGKMNYTFINGDVNIGQYSFYSPSINSLQHLATISEISGLLRIRYVNNLMNLKGLENIKSLGALYLIHADGLSNLDELSNLTSLEHPSIRSFIGINDNLLNINGLKNLEKVNNTLEISSNSKLTNIDGLLGLTSVGRDLTIEANFNLENINGLANLKDLGKNLYVISNRSITNLNALSNLKKVNWLYIGNNANLTNINGLININSVGSSCTLVDNISLKNFCVFETIIANSNDFELVTSGNLYNPTRQDIIDGNCTQ